MVQVSETLPVQGVNQVALVYGCMQLVFIYQLKSKAVSKAGFDSKNC